MEIKWGKACTTMYQVLHSQWEHLKIGFSSSQYEQGNVVIYSNMSAPHDRPQHERVTFSSLCLLLTHWVFMKETPGYIINSILNYTTSEDLRMASKRLL